MSDVVFVKAKRDIAVRNGEISGQNFEPHSWGCVVPFGATGVVLGGSSYRCRIAFELGHGSTVTSDFSLNDYEVVPPT